MLEFRTEQSALGAAPDIAVVDIGLNFIFPKTYLVTAESHKQTNK